MYSNFNVLTFVIVNQDDMPIYQADLSSRSMEQSMKDIYRNHFVLHASLDSVDEQMWFSNDLHLKTVDK